jgi:hypothetical protein
MNESDRRWLLLAAGMFPRPLAIDSFGLLGELTPEEMQAAENTMSVREFAAALAKHQLIDPEDDIPL